MPEMDGPEAAYKIRTLLSEAGFADEDQPYICCVSAYTEEQYKEIALESGMQGFFVKPVQADEMGYLLD